MVTNAHIVDRFEKDFAGKEILTIEQKFALLTALYRQACSLGHFTESDILDGLDTDIELAHILNTHVSISPR